MIFNRKFLSENIMYSKEAADYLGISKQRLIVLVNEGRIKYLKKNKHCYVFTKAELDIYKNPAEKDKVIMSEQVEMYKLQFIGEEGEFKSLYNSSTFCIEINGNNIFKDEIMNLIEKVYLDGLRGR